MTTVLKLPLARQKADKIENSWKNVNKSTI
jgi:hypothetical protein